MESNVLDRLTQTVTEEIHYYTNYIGIFQLTKNPEVPLEDPSTYVAM